MEYSGEVVYAPTSGPKPQTVIWRASVLYVVFALLSHVFNRFPSGNLNTGNPAKFLVYYAGGYLLLYLVVIVPVGILPSLFRRKTVGFWRSLNEMLIFCGLILAFLIWGGWYGHMRYESGRCGPHHHLVDRGDGFSGSDVSCEPDRP